MPELTPERTIRGGFLFESDGLSVEIGKPLRERRDEGIRVTISVSVEGDWVFGDAGFLISSDQARTRLANRLTTDAGDGGIGRLLLAAYAVSDRDLKDRELADESTTESGGGEAGSSGADHSKAADALVDIGRRADLFHDQHGMTFARLPVGGHLETHRIAGKAFKRWLQHEFFVEERTVPGGDALSSATGVLESIALFEGDEHPLEVRVARHDGAIWYDLGDNSWRAVRIDGRGWSIVDLPPPLFRRFSHQAAQVEPVGSAGNLDDLFEFLNVRAEDRLLLKAWLVTAFVPDIPHPIPDFHGEKGAGKSVGQRVLRKLIDPSATETLSMHSEVAEVVQQLSHHYCPVYDNLDSLSPRMSDLLCRAITGEGFTKRELYSDDDDIVYSYRRVILMNGVNVTPQRSDLLDRSILIGLERISPDQRRDEQEFWAALEALRPYLLGAIFDLLSQAMALHDQLVLPRLQRMADFTRWGAAVSEALGEGVTAFLDAYARNQGVQTLEAVEGDIVGASVLALMDGPSEWMGTATELLEALELSGADARLFRRNSNGKVDARGWPGAPHILSRRLRTILSNLADLGLNVELVRAIPVSSRCIGTMFPLKAWKVATVASVATGFRLNRVISPTLPTLLTLLPSPQGLRSGRQ